MDFSTLKALSIPEGVVITITTDGGKILWSKELLPDIYTPLRYIAATSTEYIDLGFTFDTKAKILIEQWISTKSGSDYPFGAVENSGVLRCCLSSPYSSDATFYGSKGSAYISTAATIELGKNELEIRIEPKHLSISNKTTNDLNMDNPMTSQAAYTMVSNLYLFAQNYNGAPRYGGTRKIGSFKYYDKNDQLICHLTPCSRKSDYVIGMYDHINKIFLTNDGGGAFIAGTIQNIDEILPLNLVPTSFDETGAVFNSIGYKNGYRVRSAGTVVEHEPAMCTGFIPCKPGDTLYVYPAFSGVNAADAINFFDSNLTCLGQITASDSAGSGYASMGKQGYGICVGNGAAYTPILNNGVSELTLGSSTDSRIAYVRITHTTAELEDLDYLIVTVNKPLNI